MNPPPPWPSILLLGPTGSGKSPLGDEMERRGFDGRLCAHFDFGLHLRRAEEDARYATLCGLSGDERETIGRVLREGALLERETFGIAVKILDGFIAGRGLSAGTWLVMNGLPRHVDQARWLDDRLRVDHVVWLDCSPDVVIERIRRDTGGDRAGRSDDGLASVRRRLDTYLARTAPLSAHYEIRGARIHRLAVAADTSPAAAMDRLAGG